MQWSWIRKHTKILLFATIQRQHWLARRQARNQCVSTKEIG